MSIRDLIDSTRAAVVADADIVPVRQVTYTPKNGAGATVLNAYVGVGFFTKSERDRIGSFESFGGLALVSVPEVGDHITYDEVSYYVTRWTKLGQLYTVYGEVKRHAGRPQP